MITFKKDQFILNQLRINDERILITFVLIFKLFYSIKFDLLK